MELGSDLAALRRIRRWTQEELAERSGLSVRTIRNVELGRVASPRRSSVDLLLRALGVKEVEAVHPDGDVVNWRGLPPPSHPLIGQRPDLDNLAQTVTANRLTTFVGPGGVGKTRMALGVAMALARSFRHGVAVVELGDIPPEGNSGASRAATVLDRARRSITGEPAGSVVTGPIGEGGLVDRENQSLLVLDNAEHIPHSIVVAVKELLQGYPCLHVLVTARRTLTEHLGVNREIRPLSVEPVGEHPSDGTAMELVLRRVGAHAPAGHDLAADISEVTELCRRLDGNPRALEFAAERLRTIPIQSLLATGPALGMLRTTDQALLPHQRSLAGSVRWSLGLLTAGHRQLLRQLASLPGTRFALDDVVAVNDVPEYPGMAGTLDLLSDLIDSSLVCRGRGSEYRLASYVAPIVATDAGAHARSGHCRSPVPEPG